MHPQIHHINRLIDELPISEPTVLDIVFEGGLFNGSYLIGILYYLKELEIRGRIKIGQLSGCSVGSLTALVYFSNTYHLLEPIYKLTYSHFKKTNNVNIFNAIFEQLRPHLTPAVMTSLNGRLFITYYNVKRNEQVIKHTYKSVDDLLDTIRKSCYCPYVIDHAFLYKKKYVDGFYPYIFPTTTDKRRVLHLNIHRFDKLFRTISIKNEKTNSSRVLTGIVEAHTFFAYGMSTSICSFVDDWTIIDRIEHSAYLIVLKTVVYLLHLITTTNTSHESNGIFCCGTFKKINIAIDKLFGLLDMIGVSLKFSFNYHKLFALCYSTFIQTYCI